MKQILSALCALPLLSAAWVSCDTIDEADRFVKEDQPTSWNFTVRTDTIFAESEAWAVQRVHRLLIEDYTGYLCVNCPQMADFIEESLMEHVDSLAVVVGMHMTGNSLSTTPTGLPFQLSTAEAATYGETLSGWNAANIGLPAVAVDRVKTDNNALYVGVTQANQGIVNVVAQTQYTRYNTLDDADTPNIDLAVNVTPMAGSYELSTLVVSDAVTDLDLKLQLWVIEDGISGFQQTESGVLPYTHNHVFRSSVNGTWGEGITLDESSLDAVAHHTLTLDAAWEAKQCSVVAFVYRSDTQEVLNAVRVKLID
jgi:hypothetical protein